MSVSSHVHPSKSMTTYQSTIMQSVPSSFHAESSWILSSTHPKPRSPIQHAAHHSIGLGATSAAAAPLASSSSMPLFGAAPATAAVHLASSTSSAALSHATLPTIAPTQLLSSSSSSSSSPSALTATTSSSADAESQQQQQQSAAAAAAAAAPAEYGALPARFFHTPPPAPPQHPLYRTTNHSYGARAPVSNELPPHFYGHQFAFSNEFSGGMYRDFGLVTALRKKRVSGHVEMGY